jgi:hypothetical protein
VKKFRFLLIFLTVVIIPVSSALGQNENESEVSQAKSQCFFELRGQKFFVGGVNEQIGNVIKYREVYFPERGPAEIYQRLDYSFKKKPISLSKSSIDFGGEFRYRPKESFYQLGFKFSYFSTKSGVGDIVRTAPPDSGAGGRITYYLSGIEFWDANIFALYNDLYPSQISDISYRASDVFRVWSVEALLYTDYLPFYAGVRLAKPNSELNLQVNQSAHVSGSKGFGYEYNNDVSLRSVHVSDFGVLVGPVFGLELSKEWGNFLLNFSLSESFLWGGVDYRGAFYDVDDIVIDWSNGFREKVYLNGDITYSDSRGLFVPVTSLDLKIGVKEGESYSLGVGGFGEFWHGLPLGPTLHRPWDIGNRVNAPSGMEWRIEPKTVKIYGFYFFFRAII